MAITDLVECIEKIKENYPVNDQLNFKPENYYLLRPLLRQCDFELIQEGRNPTLKQPMMVGAVHARKDYSYRDHLFVEINVENLQPGFSYVTGLNRYDFASNLQQRLAVAENGQKKTVAKNTAGGVLAGGAVSGIFFLFGSISPILLIPPIILGTIGYNKGTYEQKRNEEMLRLTTMQYLRMLQRANTIVIGQNALDELLVSR